MKIKRISKGEIPPMGKYVLIYANNRLWSDSTDPDNVYWKVAKCVPAKIFGNNKVPYEFKEFGPDKHFGQSIDIWCELPSLEEKKGD
jgi:hypothetical protein